MVEIRTTVIRAIVRLTTDEENGYQVVDELTQIEPDEIIQLNITSRRSNGEMIMWTGKVIGEVFAEIIDIPEWEHKEERTLNIIPGET